VRHLVAHPRKQSLQYPLNPWTGRRSAHGVSSGPTTLSGPSPEYAFRIRQPSPRSCRPCLWSPRYTTLPWRRTILPLDHAPDEAAREECKHCAISRPFARIWLRCLSRKEIELFRDKHSSGESGGNVRGTERKYPRGNFVAAPPWKTREGGNPHGASDL